MLIPICLWPSNIIKFNICRHSKYIIIIHVLGRFLNLKVIALYAERVKLVFLADWVLHNVHCSLGYLSCIRRQHFTRVHLCYLILVHFLRSFHASNSSDRQRSHVVNRCKSQFLICKWFDVIFRIHTKYMMYSTPWTYKATFLTYNEYTEVLLWYTEFSTELNKSFHVESKNMRSLRQYLKKYFLVNLGAIFLGLYKKEP